MLALLITALLQIIDGCEQVIPLSIMEMFSTLFFKIYTIGNTFTNGIYSVSLVMGKNVLVEN